MSYSTTLGIDWQDERQGQRHQPYEEKENESKFENDQKDES